MSLYINGNISDIYINEDKIKSVFIDSEQIYDDPGAKQEVDKPFYFKIADATKTATVGFERYSYAYKDGGTTPLNIDYTKFPDWENPTFEYSWDGSNWNSYTLGTALSIGNGTGHNRVFFRGNNLKPWFDSYTETITETSGENSTDYYHYYYVWNHALINSNEVKAFGNIMSLRYINFNNQLTLPCRDTFALLFYDCEKLTRAPILPATTLAANCYELMFNNTRIIDPPALPALTLQTYCYSGMFAECFNLTSAPILAATTMVEGCYGSREDGKFKKIFHEKSGEYYYPNVEQVGMFYCCTSLTTPPELNSTRLAARCYAGMFSGFSTTLIPPKYMHLSSVPTLPATTLATACYKYMFTGNDTFTATMSLPATAMYKHCYYGMFSYCTAVTSVGTISATTSANATIISDDNDGFFSYMFQGCHSLVNAPVLNYRESAYTIKSTCDHMFEYCTSLVSAPALPSTNLPLSAYAYMFRGCTSLINAPVLSATTLKYNCYAYMFADCTSLVNAPTLPATTLNSSCYERMFEGCTSLIKTPKLSATTLYGDCYRGMFKGCTSLQSITKLPATTMADTCYSYMFNGAVKASATQTDICQYVYRVPTSGTGTASSKNFTDMFSNEDGAGTFNPNLNTEFYISVPSF